MPFAPLDPEGPGASFGKAIAKVVAPRRSSSKSRRRSSSGNSSRRSSGNSGNSERRYTPRRSSGGNGNSGRRSTPERSAPAKPKVPKPVIPSIDKYLGTDSTYQGIVRGNKRSLADFLSELGRRRGESVTQFNQTKSSMERDRLQQLEDLRNEFASRGLIQSGLYGEEQGRFQSQFAEQQRALEQQQTALISDLLSQQKNFQREQDLSLEQARQDALARRAARYKIGA